MNPNDETQRLRSRIAQVRRDGDAEIARQTAAGCGPAVGPVEVQTMNWWNALASYARVAVATALTVVVNLGHVPSGPAEWQQVGNAALFALLPVILRWLNPNDPGYGRGAK